MLTLDSENFDFEQNVAGHCLGGLIAHTHTAYLRNVRERRVRDCARAAMGERQVLQLRAVAHEHADSAVRDQLAATVRESGGRSGVSKREVDGGAKMRGEKKIFLTPSRKI